MDLSLETVLAQLEINLNLFILTEIPTASGINRTHISHDPAKDDKTVFISNLDYTVTEEEVINLLSSCGKIEEFRLVHNYSGQSKGYGYLVFALKVS